MFKIPSLNYFTLQQNQYLNFTDKYANINEALTFQQIIFKLNEDDEIEENLNNCESNFLL